MATRSSVVVSMVGCRRTLLALALPLAACSFVNVEPYREPPRVGDRPCTRSATVPAVDTGLAVASGIISLVTLGFGGLLSNDSRGSSSNDADDYYVTSAIFGAAAVASAASAAYGYYSVNECASHSEVGPQPASAP